MTGESCKEWPFLFVPCDLLAIFVPSEWSLESAGNEIRSMVSLPFWKRLPSPRIVLSLWKGMACPRKARLLFHQNVLSCSIMDDSCDFFVLYKQYPNGGTIWLMQGFDETGSDYKDILAVANCLAKCGHEVRVLHAVHYKDPLYRAVFGELIGTRYYRKCPDLLVDGEYVEYESFTSDQPKNAFRNMLHNGLAQSDSIIIHHCNLSDAYMIQQIRGKIQKGVPVLSIWIFDGKEIRQLFKY